MTFSLPVNELSRLEALYTYNILDTDSEDSFDAITKIASTICDTPISAISFIDKDRQWFKSIEGYKLKENARNIAFCSHTILHDDILIINNALENEYFADNFFVLKGPNIRFYAGVPLKTHDGHNIGTLCVFDFIPRQISQKQIDLLKALSTQVIALLELKRGLSKLQDKQANLNVLLENTDTSIWSIDRNYIITSFNSVFKNIFESSFGFSPKIGEIINQYSFFDNSQDIESWNYLYDRALQGEKFTIDSELKIKGELVYLEISFTPIISNGEVIGVTVFSKNITERKLKDLQLIESENKFKAAFDLSPIGMALIMPDNKWLKVNKALCKIFDYTEEELLAKSLKELSHPDDLNNNIKLHKQLLNNEINSYEIEKCCYHKSGRIICLLLNISSVYNENNKLSYLIVQAQDISERKEWEELLLFKSNILQSVDDSIIITDLSGKVIYWNQGATAIFGYNESEVLGKDLDILYPDNKIKKLYIDFNKVVAESFIKTDWQAKTKYGNEIWLDLKTTILKDKDGKAIGFIGVSRDITDKKEVEQELIKAKNTAEKALLIKSDFLSTMSHEIRTPMNGIIGTTKLLEKTDLNKEQNELLEVIKNSSSSLLSIINNILDFSKVEANKLQLEKLPFNLRKSMDDIFFTIDKLAKEKNINLVYYISPDIPEYLLGDINRIKQLLLNLLNNGLKFSTQGELYISVDLLKETDNIFTIKFVIKDSGIGMSKETISKLFQAFSQADFSFSEVLNVIRDKEHFDAVIIDINMPDNDFVILGEKIRKYHSKESLPVILLISPDTNKEMIEKNDNLFSTYLIKPIEEIDLFETLIDTILKKDEMFKKGSELGNNFANHYPFNILLVEDNPINQKLVGRHILN